VCARSIAFCLSVFLLGSDVARGATDDARARALFRRAEVHFNLQQFDQALELYTEAYKLKPLPGFLFNIAQCQRQLGKLREALFSYKIFLSRVPHAPNRVEVEKLIRETERQLAMGKAPPPRIAPTATRGVRTPEVRAPASAPIGSDPERPPPSRRRWIWIGAGAGVTAALLATGVVTGQLASDRSRAYNDPQTKPDELAALKSSGERLRTAAIVSFSIGGAAAIGTLVCWLASGRRGSGTSAALVPQPGGVTVTVGGTLP
jgi:tetratricopeptide (TPR) repeat protein